MKQRHIFIVAGEASGDSHAQALIADLKAKDPGLKISGIGGDKMAASGVNILYPLANFGVTGFTEVVKQFRHIRKAWGLAKRFVEAEQIDLLILIDYPGFNLRFARFAKSQRLKVLYYISPQIWAWKSGRIKTIKETVDAMAVIFPFEKDIYQKANVPCYFVGHPLLATTVKPPQQRSYTVALLPGSRVNEVSSLLPVMLGAATMLKKHHPKLTFVLIQAPSIANELISAIVQDCDLEITISNEPAAQVMPEVHSVIVASGTASLEAALCHTPMAIIYKASRLTYCIASQLMKTKFLGLCNLIAQRMIVPELLQNDLNSENLFTVMNTYLTSETKYQKTKQQLKKISKMLENEATDCRLSDLALSLMEPEKLSTKEPSIRSETPHIAEYKTSD